MRKHVALLVALGSSIASAGPSKTDDKAPAAATTIDVAPVAEKLAAYKDEFGNIYVMPALAAFDDTNELQKWFFYGDGKTMYQQRVSRFTTGKGGYDVSLVAPRAKEVPGGWLVNNSDGLSLTCRAARVSGGRRDLTALSADETKTLLAKAKFVPPMLLRQPHFLGRDDDASYYYIDRLASEAGGKGFRVYVGQTGAMKQLALTNMATDSMGEIYATKSGKLKITTGKDAHAYWIKGSKKIELTVVPPADNRYLVYRELGIYGSLGTVCDDQ
ncbi:MAG TPA: hypothetical protein VMZ53_16285 [Kofleriaceae bacterium]|nr:hypothetical protein [Kofleriaceae bacterium]